MKIFIDSAKIGEIEKAYSSGVVEGLTTNPTLIKQAVEEMKKSGEMDLTQYITQLLKTAKGTPVSLEVTETEADKMVSQAKNIYKLFNPIAKNVVIKIPVNTATDLFENSFEGLRAVKQLSKLKIPVNCTLIMTPEQAIMAAKAGASYVSLFIGRIDDNIRAMNNIQFNKSDYFPGYGWKSGDGFLEDSGLKSGIDLLKQTVDIFSKYKLKAKIIAASVRNSRQARECALVGAHIATCPFHVITEMMHHLKTAEGMRSFKADIVPEYRDLTV
jgi:transaldolase